MAQSTAQILAAQLALLARDAQSIFVVSARSDVDTEGVAGALSETTAQGSTSPAFRIHAGRGLLDDPQTVGRIGEYDGLVLAVREGKSSRDDLERCRELLVAAGARIIAAVMVR